MNPSTSSALGLSIGTATLAAVTSGRAVTGRPVITRGGWVLDDFVHRVGDPVGIVAPDGSVHTGAALLAGALHELARSASAGRPIPDTATVAYPAHWRPAAADALGRAVRRIPAWSRGVVLVPDHAAALTALRANPGLPGRGVIAVCDFGAGSTTLTLVDAGNGIIGEPVRFPDFSGDLIDRALLSHVLTLAGVMPGTTGTSSIKALTRLRAECRDAKERLSTRTATAVAGAPAGARGDIRITRPELDDLVRGPLAGVVTALLDTMRRNGIAPADLAAVASVGGMAAVPAVTATLSEQLRVPVITTRRPALAAATGAALSASRATTHTAATLISPARNQPEPTAAGVAWSHAPDVPDVVPQRSARRPDPRPRVDFAVEPAQSAVERTPWHRKPLVVAVAVLAVVAGAGGVTALALQAGDTAAPAVSSPSGSPTQAPAPADPAGGAPPPPRTVVAVPAPDIGGS
jgi:actin-like ATPase involved in cell morphogenesis